MAKGSGGAGHSGGGAGTTAGKTQQFGSYADAVAWIEKRTGDYAKQYGAKIAKNKFLASDEYRAAYSQIKSLHEKAFKEHATSKMAELKKAGLAPGDRVERVVEGFTGLQRVTGALVRRGGSVQVRLDEKMMTKDGLRRFVPWHKGWRKERDSGD